MQGPDIKSSKWVTKKGHWFNCPALKRIKRKLNESFNIFWSLFFLVPFLVLHETKMLVSRRNSKHTHIYITPFLCVLKQYKMQFLHLQSGLKSNQKKQSSFRAEERCFSYYFIFLFKMVVPGNSLVVQWLRLYASTAEDRGSIPRQGTKIQRLYPRCAFYILDTHFIART